uniref:Uncharacterized protein n=1 Tax=Cacopsylla melanoneura TaxID=428564 RepID=A0A8D8SSL8_9HEMI
MSPPATHQFIPSTLIQAMSPLAVIQWIVTLSILMDIVSSKMIWIVIRSMCMIRMSTCWIELIMGMQRMLGVWIISRKPEKKKKHSTHTESGVRGGSSRTSWGGKSGSDYYKFIKS